MIIRELLVKLGFRADSGKLRKVERDARKTKTAMVQATRAAKAFNTALLRMASGYLGLMGVMTLGREMFRTIANFETLKMRLETVTGSAEDATKAFNMIKEFAKETPFQVDQLTDAFILLRTLGIDPTKETMRALGDFASAMGLDMNEMAQGIRSTAAGQNEFIARMGGQMKVNGERLTLTIGDFTKEVGRNAEEVAAFFEEATEMKGYSGAMARQMDTFAGMISNIKDALANFAYEMGEAGVLDAMKEFAQVFADTLGGSEKLSVQLGRGLAQAMRMIGMLLRSLIPMIRHFWNLREAVNGAIVDAATYIGIFDKSAGSTFEKLNRLLADVVWGFLMIDQWLRIISDRPNVFESYEDNDIRVDKITLAFRNLKRWLDKNLPTMRQDLKDFWDDLDTAIDHSQIEFGDFIEWLDEVFSDGWWGSNLFYHFVTPVLNAVSIILYQFRMLGRELTGVWDSLWNDSLLTIVDKAVNFWFDLIQDTLGVLLNDVVFYINKVITAINDLTGASMDLLDNVDLTASYKDIYGKLKRAAGGFWLEEGAGGDVGKAMQVAQPAIHNRPGFDARGQIGRFTETATAGARKVFSAMDYMRLVQSRSPIHLARQKQREQMLGPVNNQSNITVNITADGPVDPDMVREAVMDGSDQAWDNQMKSIQSVFVGGVE